MRFVVASVVISGACVLLATASGCAGEETSADDGSSGTTAGAGGGGGTGGSTCEACDCSPGDTRGCYSGPRDSKGEGECQDGTQTCTEDGTWGACAGETTPAAEACNDLDDDCNGIVDDLGDETCGVGECAVTVTKCTDGRTNTCVPAMATLEICDGVDNDCDQMTDETFPGVGDACDTGKLGVCAAGTLACDLGLEVCLTDVVAMPEECDGLDEDCNGAVDDNVPGTGAPCSTGSAGACGPGTIQCPVGALECVADVGPTPEACDGIDNDCDAATDEDDPGGGAACDTGVPGVCQAGVEHCVSGAIQCVQSQLVSPEVCNALDDDCDGTSDEANPGGGVPCGCGGTTSCDNGVIVCLGGPTVFFMDDFANASKGWTLGPEWEIGPAVQGCNDPDTDTTPTADNGVAGVNIGGCYAVQVHDYYWLTSPPFDTSSAPGVHLELQRWLTSDYVPWMNSRIEVYNGSSWIVVWENFGAGVGDVAWKTIKHDLTAHKNASMQIRFGFNVIQTPQLTVKGGWNIDDVKLTATACP